MYSNSIIICVLHSTVYWNIGDFFQKTFNKERVLRVYALLLAVNLHEKRLLYPSIVTYCSTHVILY